MDVPPSKDSRRRNSRSGNRVDSKGADSMDYYDPEVAPAPEKWNALDQMERMFLIEDYHSQTQDLADSPQGHATIHAIVENQVAMGGATPVAAELDRLMHEGLGRHDAVHAVGAILLEHMHTAM